VHSALQSAAFQAPILSFAVKIFIFGSIGAATDRNFGNMAETETGIPEFRKISPKPEFRY
jgi:hypothetical protein